jgi:ribosomal protein S6
MEVQEDEILEDSAEARVYELGFHLDPELPSEEVKRAYQEMRTLVTSKGTLVAEGEPQSIPLAYTISRQETSGRRDFDSAHFCWIVYEATASDHAEILTAANADKRIIRFIDLVTTKDAARHAVEIREFALKAPERTKDADTVLGVELDVALENVAV